MASPTIWDEDFRCFVHGAHIADPTGGSFADTQSRTAIVSILAALRAARLIGNDVTATVEEQGNFAAVWDADRKTYVRAAAIADPTGGTADVTLRTAIGQVLTAMRRGLIIAHTGAYGNPDVWDEDTGSFAFSAYTAPSGGTAGVDLDAEGRAALNSVAAALRSAGYLTQD